MPDGGSVYTIPQLIVFISGFARGEWREVVLRWVMDDVVVVVVIVITHRTGALTNDLRNIFFILPTYFSHLFGHLWGMFTCVMITFSLCIQWGRLVELTRQTVA